VTMAQGAGRAASGEFLQERSEPCARQCMQESRSQRIEDVRCWPCARFERRSGVELTPGLAPVGRCRVVLQSAPRITCIFSYPVEQARKAAAGTPSAL